MKISQEKKILEILETQQYASVEELSAVLCVSTSTIRRSLEILQQKGLVTRTHGGVKINSDNNFSPSFTFRIHQNSFEKKKIALSAIKLIKNGDIIFLDGSTSAFYIAEYLKEFENIRVITNGIDTLSLLSKNKILAFSLLVLAHHAALAVLDCALRHLPLLFSPFIRHRRRSKTSPVGEGGPLAVDEVSYDKCKSENFSPSCSRRCSATAGKS